MQILYDFFAKNFADFAVDFFYRKGRKETILQRSAKFELQYLFM